MLPNMITLYSTGCPKCEILKKKLISKKIGFYESHNTDEMTRLGITAVPQLWVGESLLSFEEAVRWVNSHE